MPRNTTAFRRSNRMLGHTTLGSSTFPAGNPRAGETRNPKPEIRKKSEIRNPNRQRTDTETPPCRELNLAGKGLPGDFLPIAEEREVRSDFGFRPSFGFRVSAFGFASAAACLLAALCLLATGAHGQTASPDLWQRQSIYQIITDRFYDGDAANNNADGNYDPSGHRGTSDRKSTRLNSSHLG